MATTEFHDANFDTEVLQSSQPVLVDFWAPWCGPCRLIAPIVEELAYDNLGAVKIGKLNIDGGTGAAQKYGVAEIPTLILFKDGEVIEKMVGVQTKPRLQKAIDAVVA